MKIEKAWERKFGKENLRGREKMKEYKRMREQDIQMEINESYVRG